MPLNNGTNSVPAERIAAVKLKLLQHLGGMDNFPPTTERLEFAARSIAKFADMNPQDHPDLGSSIVPLDWLLERLEATCSRFPPAADARAEYCQFFPPLDGISAWRAL